MYRSVPEKKLNSPQKPNVSGMDFQADAQVFIDTYIYDINVAFHPSAPKAGCVSNKPELVPTAQ